MEARSKYRILPILALGLWLAGGTVTFAQVNWEGDGATLEDIKTYGNCGAAIRVDMLTDEKHPFVFCARETNSRPVAIMIGADQEGPLETRLIIGEQRHLYATIPVAIRIDKGPVVSRTAHWNSTSYLAQIADPNLSRSLLDELATGMRVVIRVGRAQGHIDLDGSATAIADFRSRIRP